MGTDDRLDRLTATAAGLQSSVDTLAKRLRANRRGVALAIAVVIVLGAVVIDQVVINRRVRESLAQNYVTAQQQVATRTKVLCPLYTALLAATATAPADPMTPAQKAQHDAAVKIVRDGYIALGCLPPLSG